MVVTVSGRFNNTYLLYRIDAKIDLRLVDGGNAILFSVTCRFSNRAFAERRVLLHALEMD